MGSTWQIGAEGRQPLRISGGPDTAIYEKTLGERYSECSLIAMGGERGVISHPKMQFIRGLEVTITDQKMQKRLSANSGVGVLSSQKVRDPETKWPLAMCQDGSAREISSAEKRIVLGNSSRWKEILAQEAAIIDTIWRPTPMGLWKEIIGDVRG